MTTVNESIIYHHSTVATNAALASTSSGQQQGQTVYRLIPVPNATDAIGSVQFHHQSVMCIYIVIYLV